MKPKDFVNMYLSFAQQAEAESGISSIAILAQAAWESGWAKAVPGNMFFGVKDTDGINGNEQLITTTEYSRRQDLKFPVIIKVVPVTRNGQTYFKYTVKDYFRKYDSPADCFKDHCRFFSENPRYSESMKVKSDPKAFLVAVGKAGYATDPGYGINLSRMCDTIKKYV